MCDLEPRHEGGYYTGETCLCCGEPEWVDIFEIWPEDRAFMMETCCEGFHDLMVDELNWVLDMGHQERKQSLDWLTSLLEDYGMPARSLDSDCGHLVVDMGLELGEVSQKEAREFIKEHHRHNPPPAGWLWGQGIFNGPDLVGVIWVGRPVARAIDHTKVVEVNRLCVAHDKFPAGFLWNACSQAYAQAAREAKKRGYEKIMTYTLESEEGTTLKAVGWTPVAKTKGGSWNCPSRPREDKAPTCPKIRWEKGLRKHVKLEAITLN